MIFFLSYLLLLVMVFMGIPGIIAIVLLTIRGKPWGYWTLFRATALVFASLGLFINFIALFTTPMNVGASDIYGEYVIDRTMFPGKNADWQYETYQMEITKVDELKLYQLRNGQVVETYLIPVRMLDHYRNTRLKLEPSGDIRHHILRRNPLMVRRPWSHYYVFYSPHYGNMYFRKKGWWMF